MTGYLPSGRRGQLLAFALSLVVIGVLWAAIVSPLAAWYEARSEDIGRQHLLISRMATITARIPGLMTEASKMRISSRAMRNDLLVASSDAVAGAALQQKVQDMAKTADATPSSIETLAVEPRGRYRRIALRVTLSAPWPRLLHLLEQLERGNPNMLIDDLQLSATPVLSHPDGVPLDATFTVLAFRLGQVP